MLKKIVLTIGEKIRQWLQTWDYAVFLPAIAHLPLVLGEKLAKSRGVFNAIWDLDWRSLSLRKRYIRKNTYLAMQMLLPDETPRVWRIKTLKRFVHNAREEWEACLFYYYDLYTLLPNCHCINTKPLHHAQQKRQGVVLLCCHFDSFLIGVSLLGMQGLKVNVVTSSVVENPQVHPAIRQFYQNKYRGLEKYLNGGKMYHFENDIRFFYRCLKKGEIVVILADLPAAEKPTSVVLSFLGGIRRMAPGALRMVQKTNSQIGAFACIHQNTGQYLLHCSTLHTHTAIKQNPLNTMQILYQFLEHYIYQFPERWWAADLLPFYEDIK